MSNAWDIKEDSVAAQFIQQQRAIMQECLEKIGHCFSQLEEHDIWWRPYQEHNALGNIILHLCGNLGQWVIHGVTEQPDTRDRPAEFSHRGVIPKQQLLEWLGQTISKADAVIAGLDEQSLLEPRRIQGYEVLVQAAIQNSVSHLVGHTQEIIWVTRLRVGAGYQFRWKPSGKEQGA